MTSGSSRTFGSTKGTKGHEEGPTEGSTNEHEWTRMGPNGWAEDPSTGFSLAVLIRVHSCSFVDPNVGGRVDDDVTTIRVQTCGRGGVLDVRRSSRSRTAPISH